MVHVARACRGGLAAGVRPMGPRARSACHGFDIFALHDRLYRQRFCFCFFLHLQANLDGVSGATGGEMMPKASSLHFFVCLHAGARFAMSMFGWAHRTCKLSETFMSKRLGNLKRLQHKLTVALGNAHPQVLQLQGEIALCASHALPPPRCKSIPMRHEQGRSSNHRWKYLTDSSA